MKQLLGGWWRRYIADPEFSVLWVMLVLVILVFAFFGRLLTPLFVSIILAYLLDGMIKRLDSWKVPHLVSVLVVYLFTLAVIFVLLIWIIPILWRQLASLITELPRILKKAELLLMALPTQYPDFISANQLNTLLGAFQDSLTRTGKAILSYSLTNISNLLELIVYFILVPLMVFFFLMDKIKILTWCKRFIPNQQRVLNQVWREINLQMGNYVRGRILEVFIVGIVSATIFMIMGLNYAILLGALIGIATLVPFIGAIVATIPVLVIAYIQWGLSAHFFYLILIYTIISALDANVLVPLLFSGTMKLHPVAVIIAILVFGGLFGFWGVFFAIPLATVVRAVLNALQK